MKYTIIVFSDNKPGLLYRVAGLFLKRKINVESLTVSETEREGISRFTIVVKTDRSTVNKIALQLERIIEVYSAKVYEEDAVIAREIVLIRIKVLDESERAELQELCNRYWAHIIERFSTPDEVVLEIDGSEEKINECMDELKRFDIIEFVRSGRIAIERMIP
ncbi:MAG: acetolactate synthase small subunit [Patescibacteria group bacterium]